MSQPTATAFVRTQESWAKHLTAKLDKQITEREAELKAQGVAVEDFDKDEALADLYEEAIFWERFGDVMGEQREYIRERWLGGVDG